MSKKWVNTTAKDVVTISGCIFNDNTRNVANAVNYNAQILKDALNRIAELEKAIKPQESEDEGMNREEAIAYGEKWIKGIDSSCDNDKRNLDDEDEELYEFLKAAVSALQQKPCGD